MVEKMKYDIFKLSISNLKEAQKVIREKKVFELNDENYKKYETFILESLNRIKVDI